MPSDMSLIKHTAAIHMANELSLAQRKAFDIMLAHARPELADTRTHVIQMRQLARAAGVYEKNVDILRDALRDMRAREFTFNIFGKDKENATIWREYTGLFASVAFSSNLELCRYSFPHPLIELYLHPNLYANLDVNSIARLTSRHSVALYEYYTEQLGGRRRSCRITVYFDQIRALLALGESYSETKAMMRSVITPAHQEITNKTNLEIVTQGRVKQGRTVIGLQIDITKTTTTQGQIVDSAEMAASRQVLDNAQWEASDSETDETDDAVATAKADVLAVCKDHSLVRHLFKTYPLEQIRRNLDYFRHKQARTRMSKPAGWLYKAIENDWVQNDPSYNQQGRESTHTPPATAPGSTPSRAEQPSPQSARAYYDSLDDEDRQRIYQAFERQHKHLLAGFEYIGEADRRDQIDGLLDQWLASQRIGAPRE